MRVNSINLTPVFKGNETAPVANADANAQNPQAQVNNEQTTPMAQVPEMGTTAQQIELHNLKPEVQPKAEAQEQPSQDSEKEEDKQEESK